MDRDVWKEFSGDLPRLKTVAAAIRANVASLTPTEAAVDLDGISEAEEGALLTRLHSFRERNLKLVAAKKKQVLAETGRLACEACDLDFGERYGERGQDFIECHHLVAVSSLRRGQKTKLDDLALLCSNCHRMVHVRKPWLELNKLIEIQAEGAPAHA
jgi:5-methylcytosine-specific restriction enzyme A